jgi:hypothetical protein
MLGFAPFDLLEPAMKTGKIVTKERSDRLETKYVSIYSASVCNGIAKDYAVGCCLHAPIVEATSRTRFSHIC